MMQQGGDKAGADRFQEPLKAMLTERFDYLAIPTIETAQLEYVATWVKQHVRINSKKLGGLPGSNADYEGVINFW